MKLYVGLDVGLEETILCIVDGKSLTVPKRRSARSLRRSGPLWRAARIASISGSLGVIAWHLAPSRTTASRASDHCRGSAPYACFVIDDAQQNGSQRCARHRADDAAGRTAPSMSRTPRLRKCARC